METAAQDKPEVMPQLDAGRFRPAEAMRNVYQVNVEPGITRQQVLNPAFLAHIARELRPYAKLEITCDDGTLYAEAIVLQAERTWAKIHITQWHNLTTQDVSLSKAEVAEQAKLMADAEAVHRVEYKGQTKKWCVIRNKDGAYVRENEESKANAQLWLREYLKVTA